MCSSGEGGPGVFPAERGGVRGNSRLDGLWLGVRREDVRRMSDPSGDESCMFGVSCCPMESSDIVQEV